MTRLLEDLRFVIGLFFAIVSVLLLIVGFVDGPGPMNDGINLNLWTGSFMGVFAIAMIALAAFDKTPEAVAEISETAKDKQAQKDYAAT